MTFPSNANRRFLIDECLSPALTGVARERGYDAAHVARSGRSGTKDWYLVPLIVENDLIFVTNDARDFRRLYRDLDLHPGLVLLLPKVSRVRQMELFGFALDEIDRRRDTINQMVEVDREGRVSVSDWPNDKR